MAKIDITRKPQFVSQMAGIVDELEALLQRVDDVPDVLSHLTDKSGRILLRPSDIEREARTAANAFIVAHDAVEVAWDALRAAKYALQTAVSAGETASIAETVEGGPARASACGCSTMAKRWG